MTADRPHERSVGGVVTAHPNKRLVGSPGDRWWWCPDCKQEVSEPTEVERLCARVEQLERVAEVAREAMNCRGEFDDRPEHFTTYDPPCSLCRDALERALAALEKPP